MKRQLTFGLVIGTELTEDDDWLVIKRCRLQTRDNKKKFTYNFIVEFIKLNKDYEINVAQTPMSKHYFI